MSKEEKIAKSYEDLQAEAGLEVGGRVRVDKCTTPEGWGDAWVSHMDKLVGEAGFIKDIHKTLGVNIQFDNFPGDSAWSFPYSSLVKIK